MVCGARGRGESIRISRPRIERLKKKEKKRTKQRRCRGGRNGSECICRLCRAEEWLMMGDGAEESEKGGLAWGGGGRTHKTRELIEDNKTQGKG